MILDRENLTLVALSDLRNLGRKLGIPSPTSKTKPELIDLILAVKSGAITLPLTTSNRGRKPIPRIETDLDPQAWDIDASNAGAFEIPREEIVRAAFAITKQAGIEAATTVAIAKKLDCSVRQVCTAIGDVNLLREAVFEQAMAKYTAYIHSEIPGELRITAVGLNYIRFAKEYPHLFNLIYCTDRQENVSIINSSLDRNKDYVLDLFKQDYGVSESAVEDIYVKMGIFCNGIVFMMMTKSAKFDDADIYRLITEVCLKLLAAASPLSPPN
ncbi:MAG: hypothetical protein FWE62_06620, partial [Firmicutes bacterium]|nr:hypothetical protein [Bacillota bacterium]